MTDPEHYALAMGGGPAPGPAVQQAERRPRGACAAGEPDDDGDRVAPHGPGPVPLTHRGP
ncbi:hypothetical protein FM076_01070 [Streptomyces albus subsp. chlorinus]|uniref:hypothetical protein n=1 Tax=Streptomyces albus TaxID=1888 RepID=UPI00156FB267|nr:hypothetical protein [Streptomyces albus]NSC19875.1 hypothetical protein [Streptomyces albus subsp. chlorinus]